MTGKGSRDKGARGERELAGLLKDLTGYDVQRGYVHAGEPDITGLTGIHVECKRAEKLQLRDWMSQAVRDSKKFKDGLPAVFHRKSHENWMVTMELEDWTALYREWSESFKKEDDDGEKKDK